MKWCCQTLFPGKKTTNVLHSASIHGSRSHFAVNHRPWATGFASISSRPLRSLRCCDRFVCGCGHRSGLSAMCLWWRVLLPPETCGRLLVPKRHCGFRGSFIARVLREHDGTGSDGLWGGLGLTHTDGYERYSRSWNPDSSSRPLHSAGPARWKLIVWRRRGLAKVYTCLYSEVNCFQMAVSPRVGGALCWQSTARRHWSRTFGRLFLYDCSKKLLRVSLSVFMAPCWKDACEVLCMNALPFIIIKRWELWENDSGWSYHDKAGYSRCC